jgi:rhamnopyranosyl-N-acetylglucosaminyl-diphospho-decaprenol beta-1,3/1,4-galactofuranosyltransferase
VTVSTCAVVVTRNRRALLVECLSALRDQTRAPDRILVVDNASSDGTVAMLRADYPDVDVHPLPDNQGGAGGFHEGLKQAHSLGFDWIWLMDDDTMPTPTCLEALLEAADRIPGPPPALLSSKVVWTDGRLHPMNHPGFERERVDPVVRASELGLMPLRTATFVSLLVARGTVDAFGLPLRRYFLWSDDIEYTARVLRRAPGYLVPASVAIHKTEQAHTAITTAGDRFYFHLRNTLYMLRGTAWAPHEKPSVLYFLIATTVAYLRVNRFAPRVLRIVLRGLRDGLKPGAPVPARP